MNLFKNILNIDIEKSLDINYIKDFPCHFYLKNLKGKYIGGNDYLAQDVGFKQGNDLIGYTDYDLWPRNIKLIHANDQKVVAQQKSLIFYESGIRANNTLIRVISHKAPLRARNNKIIGNIGLSIILDSLLKEEKLLTKRQLDCLFYLVKGMTAKQIAKKLDLSHRTIEHYIDAIKIKLKCENRRDLISKGLTMQIIRERL